MTKEEFLEKSFEKYKNIRRYLHSIPELAYNEFKTSDFIKSHLRELGVKFYEGFAKTGIVAVLNEEKKGGGIAFRADMDALPMRECNTFTYASKNSNMHACGHDGHVAMLLFALEYLAKFDKLDKKIFFLFQPAEESEAGAKKVIEEGFFEKFEVEEIYAVHNWPMLDFGKAIVLDGAVMASFDHFDIEIKGKGTHAAYPHFGSDVILCASRIVETLQSIISREIDPLKPAVLSVTSLKAGDSYNILPDTATIKGTVRAFEKSVQDIIESRLKLVCKKIAKLNGCEAVVDYKRVCPATINTFIKKPKEALERFLNKEDILSSEKPSMGSEDFAYYLQKVKGCYIKLGSKKDSNTPMLHNPSFDFNDDLLKIGARFWIELALIR